MKKKRRNKGVGTPDMPNITDETSAKLDVSMLDFKTDMNKPLAPSVVQSLRDADMIVAYDDTHRTTRVGGGEHLMVHVGGGFEETPNKLLVFVHVDTEDFEEQTEVVRKLIGEVKGVTPKDAGLPKFMFREAGQVMTCDDGEGRGIILARTLEMAKQYVAFVERKWGTKASIEEIAAVGNMTLKQQLDELCKEVGAACTFVIRAIDGDDDVCDLTLNHEIHGKV